MLKVQGGVVYADAPRGRLKIGLTGFFVIAFILSWAGAAPMVLGSWLGPETPETWRVFLRQIAPLQVLMLFGTLITALFVTLVNYGIRGLRDLIGALFKFRVAPVWYVIVLLGPGVICLAGLVLSRRFDASLPPVLVDPAMLAVTAQIFAMYLLINTEEIAWRGYALPQLQRSLSPLNASLWLSLIWGVFHAPLFLVKGGHPAGYSIFLFIFLVMSIGLIAGYVFNKTGGSILISHLLHQAFNAWGQGLETFPVMNDGSPWPFRSVVMVLVMIGVIAAIGLALMKKPD